jgi:hypothetical protein
VERSPRRLLNALVPQLRDGLPPNICAFGESFCHRLADNPIHLRLAQLQLPLRAL